MCLHVTTLHFINILRLYTWTGIHLYASTVPSLMSATWDVYDPVYHNKFFLLLSL